MRLSNFQGAAAMLLAGLLGSQVASAQSGYDNDYAYEADYGSDDDYGYYDEDTSSYDDAEVYYENYYGADNAYDLYFHRSLGSYGEWINLPGVGYVWRPWTTNGWSPYNVGYWGWSGGNWSWISYEPFGHIVYHYGNWGYLDNYGWMWFPGYRWAPHHVQWSSYDGYVGWCPTPPRLYGRNGYRFHYTDRHYNWVHNRNFLDRHVHRYSRRPSDIWRNGRGPRNIPILSSPSRSMAERWTGRGVEQVRLETVVRSTRRGQVQIRVPDRETRTRVEREGRVDVRPWLDLKRRKESPNSDERRIGVRTGSNRNRTRTEEATRTNPRVRPEQTQTEQNREERRTTPWRRSRSEDANRTRTETQDRGESRRTREQTRTEESRRSRERDRQDRRESTREESRGSDQPSRGWRGRQNDDNSSSKESKSRESRSRDSRSRESSSKESSSRESNSKESSSQESSSRESSRSQERREDRGRGNSSSSERRGGGRRTSTGTP